MRARTSRKKEVVADDDLANIPLPIVSDRPTPEPTLGFENVVTAASRLILDRRAKDGDQQGKGKNKEGGDDEDRSEGFTIGIFGEWGSGKSSVLRAVRKRIEDKGNDKFLIVDFEAWRYTDGKSLQVELLRSIATALDNHAIAGAGLLKSIAINLLRGGTDAAAAVTEIALGLTGVEADAGGDIKRKLQQAGVEEKASDDMGQTDLFALFDKFSKELAKRGLYVVVLVDDLDRCSPEGVSQIISTLNTLMDYRRFIFVVALDQSYIVKAITNAYALRDQDGERDEAFGERFLEKVIQIPLSVPRIDYKDDLENLVGKENLRVLEKYYGFDDEIRQVVQQTIVPLGLHSNPRQFKRFINTYVVSCFINYAEMMGAKDSKDLVRALVWLIALKTVANGKYESVREDVFDLIRDADDDDAEPLDSKTIGRLPTFEHYEPDDEQCDFTQIYEQHPTFPRFVEELTASGITVETISRVLEFVSSTDSGATEAESALQKEGSSSVGSTFMDYFNRSDHPEIKETVDLLDKWIQGIVPGKITRTERRQYWNYGDLDHKGPGVAFCSLVIPNLNKMRIRLFYNAEEAKKILAGLGELGVPGYAVNVANPKQGKWGVGSLYIDFWFKDFVRAGELPEKIKKLVRDAHDDFCAEG